MKFYYCRSACSLAVRIILNELNFQYQEIEVDLKAKKTTTGEDYYAINPKGAVPAIVLDNGDLLTENQVILQYLADVSKAHEVLAPVGDLKRYHTLEWLNYIATELHKSIGIFFNPAINEEMKKTIYLPLINTKLVYVDQRLAKHRYLMGSDFSLPDAYLFVIMRWAYHFKIDLSIYPYIEAFMQRMATRPSVTNALAQENLQ